MLGSTVPGGEVFAVRSRCRRFEETRFFEGPGFWGLKHSSSAACWNCGNQHYPPSWVEASHLAGPSGYWVGHSSESFAVELLSDREPGLAPGSRGYSLVIGHWALVIGRNDQ